MNRTGARKPGIKRRRIKALFAGFFILPILLCASHELKSKEAGMSHTSENFQNGKFQNTMPVEQMGMVKIMREIWKNKAATIPEQPLPVQQRRREDFAKAPQDGLRVTWLNHSTTLVEMDGARFLIDPLWCDRASPFSFAGPKRFFDPPLPLDELPDVDAVLVSHDHYDHLDKNTIKLLAKGGLLFVVPLGLGGRLEGWGIPSEQIRELDWWDEFRVGGIRLVATPARHFSGRSVLMTDRDKTLWAGFAMVGPQHRVYYSGDTGMFEGFREIGEKLGPFDLAMVEVGAYHSLWADVHLGPEQAVEAVRQVGARTMLPVHWAAFDLAMHSWTEPAERLVKAAEGQNFSLLMPRPGESVMPGQASPIERWWPDIPWDSAEEHAIVSSGFRQEARIATPDDSETNLEPVLTRP